MYCPNCGEKIDDNYNFCPYCRTPIEKNNINIKNDCKLAENEVIKGNLWNKVMLVLACVSIVLAIFPYNIWIIIVSLITASSSITFSILLKKQGKLFKYTLLSFTISLCSIIIDILIIIYMYTIAINI